MVFWRYVGKVFLQDTMTGIVIAKGCVLGYIWNENKPSLPR